MSKDKRIHCQDISIASGDAIKCSIPRCDVTGHFPRGGPWKMGHKIASGHAILTHMPRCDANMLAVYGRGKLHCVTWRVQKLSISNKFAVT